MRIVLTRYTSRNHDRTCQPTGSPLWPQRQVTTICIYIQAVTTTGQVKPQPTVAVKISDKHIYGTTLLRTHLTLADRLDLAMSAVDYIFKLKELCVLSCQSDFYPRFDDLCFIHPHIIVGVYDFDPLTTHVLSESQSYHQTYRQRSFSYQGHLPGTSCHLELNIISLLSFSNLLSSPLSSHDLTVLL